MKKQEKENVIKMLKEYPVVKTVCERLGIGRATYYRWILEDEIFSAATSMAIKQGTLLINDVAEEGLIDMVTEKELPAIKYWLRHHHDDYSRNGYIPVIYTKGNRA